MPFTIIFMMKLKESTPSVSTSKLIADTLSLYIPTALIEAERERV
jgi:hypothetical protein